MRAWHYVTLITLWKSVLKDKRLYVLVATTPGGEDGDSLVERYLNSFKLLKAE